MSDSFLQSCRQGPFHLHQQISLTAHKSSNPETQSQFPRHWLSPPQDGPTKLHTHSPHTVTQLPYPSTPRNHLLVSEESQSTYPPVKDSREPITFPKNCKQPDNRISNLL